MADRGDSTLEEIAAIHGLSPEAVRQVAKKALERFVLRAVAVGIIAKPSSRGGRHVRAEGTTVPGPGDDDADGDKDDDVEANADRFDGAETSFLDFSDDALCALVERIYARRIAPTPTDQPAPTTAPDGNETTMKAKKLGRRARRRLENLTPLANHLTAVADDLDAGVIAPGPGDAYLACTLDAFSEGLDALTTAPLPGTDTTTSDTERASLITEITATSTDPELVAQLTDMALPTLRVIATTRRQSMKEASHGGK